MGENELYGMLKKHVGNPTMAWAVFDGILSQGRVVEGEIPEAVSLYCQDLYCEGRRKEEKRCEKAMGDL